MIIFERGFISADKMGCFTMKPFLTNAGLL
jgi:hypothetical protein